MNCLFNSHFPTIGLSLDYELAPIAQRHSVAIVAGSANSPDHRFADRVRLPIVADAAIMTEAVARLGRAWQEYRPLPRRAGGRLDVIV
jgi:hypothetical protein